MIHNEQSGRAAMVALWAMAGGQAVHWLMTPVNHPHATELRTALVVVQAVLGFGVALWVAVWPRRS